ncbi:unnamed protein product [Hyaloperonospora brassicae]|uniref:RanBP2-type domain-containing protein n=1 Tax=Hyaloperonospora brassicae TaxID=162125 RepID=A0AAV0TAF8_HYABA|nr:unnamed protein product [Hyaloperonospora brassicae]
MARTQWRAEDWSCPLCTLLNAAHDDRCAACDNRRPAVHEPRKSERLPSSVAVATVSKAQDQVNGPPRGVFFSSVPHGQDVNDYGSSWRQEKRLVVNRRCGRWTRKGSMDREMQKKRLERRLEMESIERFGDSIAIESAVKTVETTVGVACDDMHQVRPMVVTEGEATRQEEEEEDDPGMDEPCFDLLGSGNAVFAAPLSGNSADSFCATKETEDHEKRKEIEADEEEEEDAVTTLPASRYPGFIPASKLVQGGGKSIDEKLSSAGLDLSSDSEEEKAAASKHVTPHNKEEDSWEKEWECKTCTSFNEQSAMRCAICSRRRYEGGYHGTETVDGSELKWACHVCTHLNPHDVTECLVCLSLRKTDTGAVDSRSDKTWACVVCTTINDSGTTRCEVCDRLREEEPTTFAETSGRECPVCTNINSPSKTRCEICNTCLPTDTTPGSHFVDLCSSPPARNSGYADRQEAFTNSHANLPQHDHGKVPKKDAGLDPGFAEEIDDDDEPMMSVTNRRPPRARPDLSEFKHFVCLEDLRGDYGCCINYNKMFAGQRSNKSYADRLATRQAQSRKRKRAVAQREAGQRPTSSARGGKAGRGSKKRKTEAAQRRATPAGDKVVKPKRAKKKVGASSTRRANAAPTYQPGINHYDDSAADLGDDLSTMAWEGIGSAGYF